MNCRKRHDNQGNSHREARLSERMPQIAPRRFAVGKRSAYHQGRLAHLRRKGVIELKLMNWLRHELRQGALRKQAIQFME